MVVSILDYEEGVFEGIQKYLLENKNFSVVIPEYIENVRGVGYRFRKQ
ncbi:MAG: hypothetical protein SO415_14950 [Oliverpabstia sp.]|nr:hypothetical protein [Oliverpabstia sp.]